MKGLSVFLLCCVSYGLGDLVISPGKCPTITPVLTFTTAEFEDEYSKIGSSKEEPFTNECDLTRTVKAVNDHVVDVIDGYTIKSTNKKEGMLGKAAVINENGLMQIDRQLELGGAKWETFTGAVLDFTRSGNNKIVSGYYCREMGDGNRQEEVSLYVTGRAEVEEEAKKILEKIVKANGLEESYKKFEYSPTC